MSLALALGLCFLSGTVPFGWFLVQLFQGRDIRSQGSGNIGATNALRAGGWKLGLITLLLDGAKGWFGYWVGSRVLDSTPEGWIVAGLMVAAPLGHCFTPWLGFRGGKGVATGLGVLGAVDPRLFGAALVGFVVFFLVSRRASLGSFGAVLTGAAGGWIWQTPGPAWGATLIAILVILRHHQNLRRLMAGNEPRFGRSRA